MPESSIVVPLLPLVSLYSCSNRLQLLSPFDKWGGKDLQDMTVLLKVIINSTLYYDWSDKDNKLQEIYK